MTALEIETIENCIYAYNENILFVQDNEFNNEESIVMLNKMLLMYKKHKPSFILIDLTTGKRPNAQKVEAIKNTVSQMTEHCKHIAFYTGKNKLLNVAVQFVLGDIGIKRSFSKTKQEALRKIDSL